MQCLAAKGRQRLLQRGAGSGHQPPPAAIERITHDRESGVGEVHADLMRTAGFELHAQQRVAAEALLDAKCVTPPAHRAARPCACAASGAGRMGSSMVAPAVGRPRLRAR